MRFKKSLLYFATFLVSIFYYPNANSLTVGDWSSVSTQSHITFPTGASDNHINGFTQMNNGFTLYDENTSCTFNSSFTVSGSVELNGGKLYLEQDLIFSNSVTSFVNSSGTSTAVVYGQNHMIVFSTGINDLSGTVSFVNCDILLNTDISISDTIFFDGNCCFNGRGSVLDLVNNGGVVCVDESSSLTFENLIVLGLGGSEDSGYINNLKCLAPDSHLTFRNCGLIMSNNYSFTEGWIHFYQDDSIYGRSLLRSQDNLIFAFQSPQYMTIHPYSRLLLEGNLTFSYDSDSAEKDHLIMVDNTSVFHLDGTTLHSTRTGLRLDTGVLVIDNLVSVQNDAENIPERMELHNTLTVEILGGGTFDFIKGYLRYVDV